MAAPVRVWFDNLGALQHEMKNLNHLTKDDLKDFSKQTLKELAPTELIQGNIRQFCQNEFGLMVPNNAFSDLSKTFLWFLSRISFPIEEAMLTLFRSVAIEHRPDLRDTPRQELAKMTLGAVYGSEPFDTNPVLRELHALINQDVPDSFYPADASPLKDSSKALKDVINSILN